MTTYVTLDGNEAAARIAYLTNETIAIYPITPASAMGELSDVWASKRKPNLFGTVPEVIEMQSEGGAAGAVHGALQAGSLTTTFTASQGLLLMIPNMYKIAGQLMPCVIHVAARSLATHALSIFGDHSDVMATRATGFALLAASSVQEAQDLALVAQLATMKSRVPFIHFFDGFRTSHEVNKIELVADETIKALLDPEVLRAHRARALDPNRPVLRGSAQNPDVFFQAREAVNGYYDAVPGIVQDAMDALRDHCGRAYSLFDYVGDPNAERVILMMGSGCGAAEETVRHLMAAGEKVGLLKVRLYRPWSTSALLGALPESARRIAVLDRTKEPGSGGEPLYLDVVAALAEGARPAHVIGGRYGLSSKEFTPGMVKAVFDELERDEPRRHFTIGIRDDVTNLSLPWEEITTTAPGVKQAVFFGLGSDGTVGANKNSIKIIGEHTPLFAQGYFVYDSKKSGSTTVSHLRFGPQPINSTYLVSNADFVACHQFSLLDNLDVFAPAREGATFLLNSPHRPDEVWDQLSREAQDSIIAKRLRFFVVDGHSVANEVGLKNRINTVMQTCFFALADILPRDEAIERIKDTIRKTWGSRGESIVRKNIAAVDNALDALHEVKIPDTAAATRTRSAPVPETAPDFVQRVTAMIIAGKGDLLPVSAMPIDGTFPTSTSRYERRSIASEIPVWDPEICIECALCALVCPHAAIRMKVLSSEDLARAPEGFATRAWNGREYENGANLMTIQVAPDDCTGCNVCAEVCPAQSKEVAKHKALDMRPKHDHLERQRRDWDHFLTIPEPDRTKVNVQSIKGSQMLEPLFEFSGACAGCGETPYLKLLTQLFGDRLVVANATGCSSIYGGNLPTTPWTTNENGRGPAWANSLFEDNAEFGLGMRLGIDRKQARARFLLAALAHQIGEELTEAILAAPQESEAEIQAQRRRVAELDHALDRHDDADAKELRVLSSSLVKQSVWIVGGDGWAYDIGFGGLDHVIASDRNVNILVLDTEVYSNTGGQASKATFRAATAKFAAAGKTIPKKDLGQIAMAYGNVYVAQIALGAKPKQTIEAFLEAERHDGPSLIIAYSPCIAHGIDMAKMIDHQKNAVGTGYWPLYRFDPEGVKDATHPFRLDSGKPRKPFKSFAETEARFAMLMRTQPERAEELLRLAQKDINDRWNLYTQLADVEHGTPSEETPS